MKYIFVGDIHGKWEVVETALAKDGRVVFVGDLMDSFNRSINDHERCIQLVLKAIKEDKADAILGNHELSYLFSKYHRCSGFSLDREAMIIPYKKEILDHFMLYLQIDNFLITHAGMHLGLKKNLDDMDNWVTNFESSAHWVGYCRGGNKPYGGIFWCDWKMEFKPIPGLNQIFGHTRRNGIETKHTEDSKNWCIDCLESKEEFLELEI